VSVPEEPPLDAQAREGLKKERVDRAETADFPLAGSVPEQIPAVITGKGGYPVQALLLHYSNPLISHANRDRWREAWSKIAFVVSFSPYLDESTAGADLVLPDHVYFERWQEFSAASSSRFAVFGVSKPVIAPIFGSRQSGDVVIELAHAMGGPVAQAFPWQNYPDYLKWASIGVFASRRGSIVEPGNGGQSWTELLERRGWWYPSYQTPDEFWEQLQEKGGWWDPVYYFGQWDLAFATPSGRFEFDSTRLREEVVKWAGRKASQAGSTLLVEERKIMRRFELSAVGDTAFQPHHEGAFVEGEEEEYPFELITYRPIALGRGRNANQPFLQEILGPHVHMDWDSWVEINPRTARKLGINNKDWVELKTPFGTVKTRACYFEGIFPGVLCMPAGLGHTGYGRWAKGIGSRAKDLLSHKIDPMTGALGRSVVRVRLSKV